MKKREVPLSLRLEKLRAKAGQEKAGVKTGAGISKNHRILYRKITVQSQILKQA
jgi:hypothetical protein